MWVPRSEDASQREGLLNGDLCWEKEPPSQRSAGRVLQVGEMWGAKVLGRK